MDEILEMVTKLRVEIIKYKRNQESYSRKLKVKEEREQRELDKRMNKKSLSNDAILIGKDMRLLLKQKNLTQIEAANILEITPSKLYSRLIGRVRFTDEQIKAIKDTPIKQTQTLKEQLYHIYIKYNNLQYTISNMSNYNKMNEEMARLLMDLLNELEGLVWITTKEH